MSILSISKIMNMDFPGGPVVKNPPCNAEDKGLIPYQGTKIPQAIEQPSPVCHNQGAHTPLLLNTHTATRKSAQHTERSYIRDRNPRQPNQSMNKHFRTKITDKISCHLKKKGHSPRDYLLMSKGEFQKHLKPHQCLGFNPIYMLTRVAANVY